MLLTIFWLFTWIVSNEVPEHPVVSPVSGSVYERRLIEKYIADNGVDPVNGKEMTIEQLVEIKSKSKKFCLSFTKRWKLTDWIF